MRDHRRGILLVLATVLLIVIFAFVSLTVDVGYIAITKAQLQSAADAAALGSAPELAFGEVAVRETGKSLALMNSAAGKPVQFVDSDIELGFFDYSKKGICCC